MKFENEPLKSWWDFGKIYKRNRDKDGNIENFRACSRFMVCYSVMSNEGLDKYNGGGGGLYRATQTLKARGKSLFVLWQVRSLGLGV